MSKFRKKPIVVEAEQFWLNKKPWPDGVIIRSWFTNKQPNTYCIETLEGKMNVTPGDWIITGVEGEKYAIKPHIFLKTYEPVEE